MRLTPPIRPSDGPVLFSMIGSAVLLPYLVAVKSLHARLGGGRVALLDDGTLTAADRALLDAHLGKPPVRIVSEIDTGACPRGGTWERLLTLLDMTADDYVIQLDADTLTVGDIPDIVDAVAHNRAFTLAGEPGVEDRGILPLPDFVESYRRERESAPAAELRHVQFATETRFGKFPDAARFRYVRGCSGFAGFPRGGPTRADAEAFSRKAEAVVGADTWRRWGSEQVASNFLLANCPGAELLPWSRYSNYLGVPAPADTRFLHFLGTWRYVSAEYARRTAEAVRAL